MALAESQHTEHEPRPPYEAAAEKHYIDLPYHNFEHAQGVASRAMEIAHHATGEGVLVDMEVVRLAALFHDAGYHEDHEALGYETKEDYSIAIAREELTALGVSQATIEGVVACIEATKKDSQAQTTEAKIVRLADIYNIGDDSEEGYADFVANGTKLKEEAERLKGEPIDPEAFKAKQIEIIEAYLAQDLAISLSDYDSDGKWIWGQKARANLERYKAEPIAA